MTPDDRPVGVRALLWLGLAVLLVLGLPLTAMGLLVIDTTIGKGMLCGGLVLLVCAVGGLAREAVERRVRTDPPRPRLAELEGRPALHLPRAAGPAAVSSCALAGLGAMAALGALSVAVEGRWGWSVLLALVAAWLLWNSSIHRSASLAGGLWFSSEAIRHEDRGVAVVLPWDAVTGVVPQQPMQVLVRPDQTPETTRTGPRGRAWRPVARDGTLVVDTRHLAGGTALASYVIGKAVTDPTSRDVLGTAASLPPDGAMVT